MPRDAGDDAYAWMAAQERATTVVRAYTTWKRRKDGRRALVTSGGFSPIYEPSDGRIFYRFVGATRRYEMHIDRFVRLYREVA